MGTGRRILAVAGSPSATSRTARVLDRVAGRLRDAGHGVDVLRVRDLPAGPLLAGDASDPALRATAAAVAAADGVVVATPVYKAAYAGLLKVWLDQLPQFALRGKAVLPLAVGGSLAHVLAIDYALRPVLCSFDPRVVSPGYFVLETAITRRDDGGVHLDPTIDTALMDVVDRFAAELG